MSYSKTATTLPTSFSCVHASTHYWEMVPESCRADLLSHHRKRALNVVEEYQLPLPNTLFRFELAVMLAVEAQLLFFNAAIYEPSQEDLDRFFADFLRRALQPYAESLP